MNLYGFTPHGCSRVRHGKELKKCQLQLWQKINDQTLPSWSLTINEKGKQKC